MYTAAQMNNAILKTYFDDDQAAQYRADALELADQERAGRFSLRSLAGTLRSLLPDLDMGLAPTRAQQQCHSMEMKNACA